jgi:hypothetical protein
VDSLEGSGSMMGELVGEQGSPRLLSPTAAAAAAAAAAASVGSANSANEEAKDWVMPPSPSRRTRTLRSFNLEPSLSNPSSPAKGAASSSSSSSSSQGACVCFFKSSNRKVQETLFFL